MNIGARSDRTIRTKGTEMTDTEIADIANRWHKMDDEMRQWCAGNMDDETREALAGELERRAAAAIAQAGELNQLVVARRREGVIPDAELHDPTR